MLRFLTSLVILLAGATALRAEALDRRQVPAGALWFIHADFDAARQSVIGGQLRDLWLARPENARAIDRLKLLLRVDPIRDIQSITVYGSTYTPDAGVVLARGKVDRERLLELLKTLPGYRTESAGERTLYFWDETEPNRRHSSAGAFYHEDMIVVAPDGPAVLAALDVLDGKSPGLSSDSALASDPPAGTIIQAAAKGLAEARGVEIQSPIVRQCESGTLCMGEREGQVFFGGHIVTQSPDVANAISDLISGAKAMGLLQSGETHASSELLRAIRVSTKDKAVDVQWQYSSQELVKIVRDYLADHSAVSQPEKAK